jgi:membrane protease YdiL (CAAX protease family)
MESRGAARAIGLTALAVAGGAVTCELLADEEQGVLEALAVTSLGFELFLGILAFAGAALLPGRTSERLGLRPGRLSPAQTLLMVLGTLGVSLALDGLLDLTQLKQHSSLSEFEGLIDGARGRALLLVLLGFALAPGISEELLCRGLLQRAFVNRLGAAPGILLASAIFGALHIDPVHAIFAVPLGLYLGIACHLAGEIRTPIACHTVNNLVAVGTGAFLPELDAGGLPAVAAGAAASAGALWLVWRRVGIPPPEGQPAGGAVPAPDAETENPL